MARENHVDPLYVGVEAGNTMSLFCEGYGCSKPNVPSTDNGDAGQGGGGQLPRVITLCKAL